MTSDFEVGLGMQIAAFLQAKGADEDAQLRILTGLMHAAMVTSETPVLEAVTSLEGTRYDFRATSVASITEPKQTIVH